jgi:hypothetical protein
MGQWEEAEKMLVQLIDIEKAQLGEDHPGTLNSMNNLAMAYMNLERWSDAKRLIIRVLETRKVKFGVDNLATLVAMANLAFVWMSSGHEAQAIDLLRDSVAGRKRLGHNDAQTLSNAEYSLELEAKGQDRDS